jgi:prephenate dehydrogenase
MLNINSITIIGVGLIGGSVGLGLKKKDSKIKIVGVGRNINRLKIAKQKGCIDLYTTDLKEGVKDADIVIVSTPVKIIPEFIKQILPYVKPNCVITDVGSVKYEIFKSIKKEIKKYKNINFIGSHPIAGSEKKGVEFAEEDLFENSVCVVCYDKEISSKEGLEKIKYLWKSLNSKVILLEPKKHDKILALTSHFLHIISYLLTKKINSKEEYLNFVGGAYRDMTRISASDPELWAEICFMNKRFIKNEIESFIRDLNKVRKILDDFEKLKKFLTKCYNLKIKNYE